MQTSCRAIAVKSQKTHINGFQRNRFGRKTFNPREKDWFMAFRTYMAFANFNVFSMLYLLAKSQFLKYPWCKISLIVSKTSPQYFKQKRSNICQFMLTWQLVRGYLGSVPEEFS